MAWLYSRSSTWRQIVSLTRQSPLYMAAFAGACVVVPVYLGSRVMSATNNPTQEGELEKQLRAQGGMNAQVLARAQKEQLQVLLDEIKEGSGNERYRAALDGKRLGTRAQGTTAGAVAIRRSGTDGN